MRVQEGARQLRVLDVGVVAQAWQRDCGDTQPGELLAMAQAGRQPDSDVTVAQLLDQYVSTAGWEPAGHGPDRDVQDLLGHRQDLLDPPMAAAATDTRPRPCSPRPGRWRFRCCGSGIPERTWPARQGRRDINALAAGGRHAGCGR
jgi:hypothetical protein